MNVVGELRDCVGLAGFLSYRINGEAQGHGMSMQELVDLIGAACATGEAGDFRPLEDDKKSDGAAP